MSKVTAVDCGLLISLLFFLSFLPFFPVNGILFGHFPFLSRASEGKGCCMLQTIKPFGAILFSFFFPDIGLYK